MTRLSRRRGWSIHALSVARIAGVQSEPENSERSRKVRVKVNDARRRALIELADVRDLEDQMRGITERLGGTVIKVGEGEEAVPGNDKRSQ